MDGIVDWAICRKGRYATMGRFEEAYERAKEAAIGKAVSMTLIGYDSLENMRELSEAIDKDIRKNEQIRQESMAVLAANECNRCY